MKYTLQKILLVLLLTLVGIFPSKAQEQGKLLITHYLDEDYNGHPQNLNLVIDEDGLIYLGNGASGIFSYDGKVWQKALGISQSIRSMSKSKDGTIFIGAGNDFGYIKTTDQGAAEFISLLPHLPEDQRSISQVWHLHHLRDTAYFFTNEKLFRWNNRMLEAIPLDKKYYRQFEVEQNIYFNNRRNFGIARLEGDKIEPLKIEHNPMKKLMAEMLPYDEEHLLIVGRYEGLFLLHKKTNVISPLIGTATPMLQKDRINCALILADGNIALGSVHSGITIVDRQANFKRKIDKEAGLLDLTIWKMQQDAAGNLWVANNNGLAKIELNTGIDYWDDKNGFHGPALSINRFGGQLFVATATGVLGLKENELVKVDANDNFTNALIQLESIPGQQGKILAGTDRGILTIENFKASPLIAENAFLLYQYKKDPKYLISTDFDGNVCIYVFQSNQWKLHQKFSDMSENGVWASSITEDDLGNIWFGTEESGVYTIQNPIDSVARIIRYAEKANLPAEFAYSVDFFDDEIMLYSQNGFYKWNAAKNSFDQNATLSQTLGFSNEFPSVFPFSFNSKKDIWLAGQKNSKTTVIGAYRLENGKYELDKSGISRIQSKSINAIFPEEDNVWVGTPDRLYRYKSNRNGNDRDHQFHAIINRIQIGPDSVHFQGHILGDAHLSTPAVFDYQDNFIRFTYGATSYFDEDKNLFSYKLTGLEDEWSDWSPDEYKEFSNIPEGEYTFELRAKDIFGNESNICKYSFEILPPWHRTGWAYLAYLVLGLLFFYWINKMYNRKLHAEKDYLEAMVDSRTEEVEKQKKSLEESNEQLKKTIDQLTQTQSQLIQSEKMASLGQLTAGIAHEINNPINYVSSSTEALKLDYLDIKKVLDRLLKLKSDQYSKIEIEEIIGLTKELDLAFTIQEMNELFQGVEEGANRTQNIVKGLRIFSRNTSESFHQANINEGLDSTLLILNNKIYDKIKLEKAYGDLPLVNCQISKLNQVFLNIIVNALHAIEQRTDQTIPGKIYIETKHETEFVSIKIQDNGIGMEKKVSQKVFEPFFTTKDVGEGTGLGLSLSYGIIQEHQGSIELESELGKGTSFFIKIPIQPAGREEG